MVMVQFIKGKDRKKFFLSKEKQNDKIFAFCIKKKLFIKSEQQKMAHIQKLAMNEKSTILVQSF